MRRSFCWLIIPLLIITRAWASLDAEGVNDGRLINISDQFAFSYISNPVLGANDETLFFVVENMDYEAGTSRFQIMRQALANGSVTELTAGDYDSWEPVLSNDGRSLFFLSNREGGTTQLWKKSLNDDSRAVQITDLEAGVDDINFSSDQTRLLLVQKDKKNIAAVGAG